MEKVEEGGKELSFGDKIMDTVQSSGKAPSLSENIGSVIDGAITLALSCPFSKGLEDTD